MLDRLGVHGRVAQPSHVLIAMGADPASARGSLRLSLGHTSTDADVDAALAVLPAAVERARQAALASSGAPADEGPVAMSGGVDSSVAAARMVDAGHDVVGVHLALSAAPALRGSRGCCSRRTPAMPAASPMFSTSRSTSGISPAGSSKT